MASDSDRDSDRESFFADCHPASGTDSTTGGRKRQISMPEMARQAQLKRARRHGQGRRSHSPRDAARGRRPGPGESPAAQQPPVTLEAIQRLIETGNREVIAALDAKLAQLAKRLDIVESECMDKDLEIKRLSAAVATQERENADLRERLEGIDLNRRLSSLILTCDDFGPRAQNEDIEARVVQVLKNRFPDLLLTVADIQVAHRLQNNSKVIVKFLKRRVRDDVFERRFSLLDRRAAPRRPAPDHSDSRVGQRMAPLFINESLTPACQQIFNSLLQARKPENGAKVTSVFTRRGQVYCRKEKNGTNILVRDQEQLKRILRKDVCPPGQAAPAAASGAPPPVRRPAAGSDAAAPSSPPSLGAGVAAASPSPRLPSGAGVGEDAVVSAGLEVPAVQSPVRASGAPPDAAHRREESSVVRLSRSGESGRPRNRSRSDPATS